MAPRTRSWSMFPERHSDVADLLEDDDLYFTFHPADQETGHIKEHDTNVMGHFKCRNPACHQTGWSSKKIAVWIRLYPESRYNARVFHQRCRSCNQLSKPTLDDSYEERIAYRLRKWSDVAVEEPPFDPGNGKPHEKELCEGCKNGHCTAANLEDRMNRLFL
ncbi:hypothetical protein NOR_00609 [Metarhizium rileyi]|uniref:3CxxC-type domain-containing protein n=1 Tax=Metarhizium rileyi (strain RCEF 4871) TaxID=1649241 RepID=A0A167KPT8_METRR|nr:hypothetical protein NOR_00609 [Metarhizium rileyi RCEF 4871]